MILSLKPWNQPPVEFPVVAIPSKTWLKFMRVLADPNMSVTNALPKATGHNKYYWWLHISFHQFSKTIVGNRIREIGFHMLLDV